MIADVLSRLLWMSLTGTVAISAVLFLRLLFRRAPKIFSYLLWSAVLFRLLCPVAPESGFSVVFREVSKPQAEVQTGKKTAEENKVIDSMRQSVSQFVSKEAERGTVFSSKKKENSVLNHAKQTQVLISKNVDAVLFAAWIFGMAFMLAFAVLQELRLRKYLRRAVHEDGNIYTVSGINTPFVMGLFFPRIYLPNGLAEQEREYMLLHEQTHIRRKDMFFRRLSFLALFVHWFNPFVWCAFFLSGRDMEMSCDEAVIKRLGDGIKKPYSASLLKLSTEKETGMRIPTAFGGGDTGQRIKNILRYKRMKKGIAALCVLALFAALVMLTTNPKRTGTAVVKRDTQMPESQTEPSENVAEENTEGDSFHEDAGRQETDGSVKIPAEYEFSADLTHDGADETVKVEVSNGKYDIPQVFILVFDGEKKIFEEEVYVHGALGSMYSLVERNEGAYLMRYAPLVDHDMITCEYEVFSLDGSGNKVEFDSGQMEHELWKLDSFNKEKWIAFAEKENEYFKNAFLLVSGLFGELECADTENPQTYEERFSWAVDIMDGWDLRESTIEENLDTFIAKNIDAYEN